MTVTVASFRSDFPEFTDPTKYPDPTVTFWINLASNFLNPRRFANMIDFATELFVAHGVTLAARNAASAANGSPGQSSGPITGKGVGGVSVSYDTASGTEPGAAWYNLTSYGVQLYGLMQIAGMGGIQL